MNKKTLKLLHIYGLELLPKLDDIPELKQILTPYVIQLIQEKCEIRDTYNFANMFYEKFPTNYLYAKRCDNDQKYLFKIDYDKSHILAYEISDMKSSLNFKCEFHTHQLWGYTPRYSNIKPTDTFYKCTLLRVHNKSFSDKEIKKIIKTIEKRRKDFISFGCCGNENQFINKFDD